MNIAKVLLEGGWIFEEVSLRHALGIAGFDDHISTYVSLIGTRVDNDSRPWRPDSDLLCCLQSAHKFSELMGFPNLTPIEDHHKS